MKAAAFAYRRVNSLHSGLVQVASAGDTVKIMAGSQSLGPMLNLRLARPGTLIDISGMEELRVAALEGDTLRLGSGLTHAEIEDGEFEAIANHPWRRIAAQIAYRGIRNRGTLGGSLAHADPAADWVLAAWAFGAQVEIASRQATRRVAIQDFMTGAYATVLKSDEILVAVLLPRFDAGVRWGYYKFCRKPGEFALASCAAVFGPAPSSARVVIVRRWLARSRAAVSLPLPRRRLTKPLARRCLARMQLIENFSPASCDAAWSRRTACGRSRDPSQPERQRHSNQRRG